MTKTNYEKWRDAKLKDPEIKKEYDALAPEYELRKMLLDLRIERNLTQKELADISGVSQADISRIENGTRNPSIRVMQKIALSLGATFTLQKLI